MQIGLNLSLTLEHVGAGAPTLDMTFTGTGNALDSRITFTRASTATYFDSNGVLQTAGNNVPRLDYNPITLAAQGLLIEEQRTNSIRNNTMVGAVAGTPGTLPTNWNVSGLGTLTREVVGTGTTANGIAYIDLRFSGTTSTSQLSIRLEPSGTGAIAAANGQTWAMSMWSAIVAGGLTNINSYGYAALIYDAAGAFIGSFLSPGVLNTTSTLTRTQTAGTIATVGTAFIQPQINFLFNSGVAIDITLRIGLPQLELGAFATSVIPTTTTALTRSADVASVNTLSPWYNQTEGTVYAELQSLSPLTAVQSVALGKYPNVWQIEAGASDSTVWWYGVGAELFISTTYNNIGTVPSGINKFAVSLAASGGQSRSSLNGAAAVNRNGTLTGTATGFFLGRDSTAGLNNFLNGYLRRLTYYPRASSAAELQAITA